MPQNFLNIPDDFQQYGWSGVYSLPRSLWLREDGFLGIAPVKELHSLRYNEQSFDVTKDQRLALNTPDSCELYIECKCQGNCHAGISIKAGDDKVLAYYDSAKNELVVDLSNSGSVTRNIQETAPLKLGEDELLSLTVYIDRSVVEVFANDKQAICRRAYFSKPDDVQVSTYLTGKAEITSIHAWSIAPTNPY